MVRWLSQIAIAAASLTCASPETLRAPEPSTTVELPRYSYRIQQGLARWKIPDCVGPGWVRPDPDIDYKMTWILPSPFIDYK